MYDFLGAHGTVRPLSPRQSAGGEVAGAQRIMVRAVNRIGESQGLQPLWNPAGYLRNVVEYVDLEVG